MQVENVKERARQISDLPEQEFEFLLNNVYLHDINSPDLSSDTFLESSTSVCVESHTPTVTLDSYSSTANLDPHAPTPSEFPHTSASVDLNTTTSIVDPYTASQTSNEYIPTASVEATVKATAQLSTSELFLSDSSKKDFGMSAMSDNSVRFIACY